MLSAVDAHVGEHIFRECLADSGVLAGTTRVLVTHQVCMDGKGGSGGGNTDCGCEGNRDGRNGSFDFYACVYYLTTRHKTTRQRQVALTLPEADWVVIMGKDGSILEQGSRAALQVRTIL